MSLLTKNTPTFPKAARRTNGKSLNIRKDLNFDWYEVQQYLDSVIDMISPRGKSASNEGLPVNI